MSESQLKPTPVPKFTIDQNPLLHSQELITVDLPTLEAPTLIELSGPAKRRRELLNLRRQQTAKDAVERLTREVEIYGFTRGQFSLLDLLTAILEKTGPVNFSFSTWTAARHEIQALNKLKSDGLLLSCRWLVDLSFIRRDPEAAFAVRQTFGPDAIRVAQCHAKFAVFQNSTWELVLRTSMNLNMNPRTEDFTLAHDPQLAAFLGGYLDAVWKKQRREVADEAPGVAARWFKAEG